MKLSVINYIQFLKQSSKVKSRIFVKVYIQEESWDRWLNKERKGGVDLKNFITTKGGGGKRSESYVRDVSGTRIT